MSTPVKIPPRTVDHQNDEHEMRDEVDFVRTNNSNNNNNNNNKLQQQQSNENMPKTLENKEKKVETTKSTEQKRNSTKERLSLFSFSRKLSHKHQQQQQNGNVDATNNSNNNYIKETNGHVTNEKRTNISTTVVAPPFSFTCQPPKVPIGTPPRQHKFAKGSSSLARLFSSTYNAKKFEKQEQKRQANAGKFHTYGGRRRSSGPYFERFKSAAKEDTDADSVAATDEKVTNSESTSSNNNNNNNDSGTLTRKKRRNSNSCSELATLEPFEARHEDLGAKALRTLSRGLGKLWWKRTHSVDISTPDPEFKVAYLGNVLTGWAKGEGCVEKQLATLWRNYTQNNKPDVIMRIKVCASGLKATTRQHGLTEYWANRITHCCAPKNYPRVFCWIYRHEGRKLKHELRCHAVLCSKEKIVHEICDTLKENLECALREFKRDKLLKQNARLSLANAAYDNPSLPRRKILLSVGGNNYRPPLERSKSAPKLMAIEEAIGEEDGDEIEETNEPEMKPCCQRDSLYPAMTLGRRRCRRGHSIRRTGKTRPSFVTQLEHQSCCHEKALDTKVVSVIKEAPTTQPDEQCNNYGSNDSDDFEKLLKHNNYDSNSSLATELLPYFDMQLHKNKSSSLSSLHELKDVHVHVDDEDTEPLSLLPTINTDPNADPNADITPAAAMAVAAAVAVEQQQDCMLSTVNHSDLDDEPVIVGLRRPGVCSDGEEDDFLDVDDDELRYFRQQSILNILHRNSMRKMAQLSLSSDEHSSLETPHHTMPATQYRHQLQSSISSNASSTGTTTTEGSITSADQHDTNGDSSQQRKQFQPDSDEGSISSGCETASTVTTPNQDDLSLQYRRHSSSQQMHSSTKQQHPQQIGLNGILFHPSHGSDVGLNDEDSSSPITVEEIYQRLEARLNGRHNSDATTFSSSSSITLKMSNSPEASMHDLNDSAMESVHKLTSGHVARAVRRLRRASAQREQCESDSECSDESGYVEFQERDKRNSKQEQRHKSVATTAATLAMEHTVKQQKPQTPPKPLPRRHITSGTTTAV